MSDLSQLLGDLYADDTPAPKAPDWSSDEALDDAFASWVPGPAEGSAAAERSIVADALGDVPRAPAPVADEDWMAMTAPASLPAATDLAGGAVVPAPAAFVRWTSSDDDILPARRAKARFSLSLRRR
jgi:hypothetical protein